MGTPIARVICPAVNLVPPKTPPNLFADSIAYFRSIPWTAALVDHPGTIAFIPQCFNPLDADHDQFVGETISGGRGLAHMLCLFTPDDDQHMHDPSRPITKVQTLWAVGAGLSGWVGILHGGMTMTMLDESMGVINEINLALGKTASVFHSTSVTGSLDIKFLAGIPINSCVCFTAEIDKWEGRKTRVKCLVTGENEQKLAQGSSTWVTLKPKI